MIVKSRETATGTEYWDTELMKSVFVPRGTEPDFEVTDPNAKEQYVKEDKANVFDDMTVQAMKDYAAEHELDIPKDLTKSADIAAWLTEQTNEDTKQDGEE